jgi:hypothetical protein
MKFEIIACALAGASAIALSARPAHSFHGCDGIADGSVNGCWPSFTADAPAGAAPGPSGSKRWEFCWAANKEGLELHDVKYGSDPSNRRLVANKISIPYLMTRYPDPTNAANPSPNPTTCGDATGPAFNDTPEPWMLEARGAQMHCLDAPATVCNLGERGCDTVTHECINTPLSCTTDADCIGFPSSGTLDPAECTGACTLCNGVCVGTQIESGGQLEVGGANEAGSDSSAADVVLTTTYMYGGYQFIQRYRFKDDGRLVASFRFGGLFRMQWHQHIVYWRFELDPDGGANDLLQRCDSGACANNVASWSTRGCECAKTTGSPNVTFRVFDQGSVVAGTPSRSIVISGGPNDGTPDVCVNTDKDYCALRARPNTNERLTPHPANCTDGLDGYASGQCISNGDISSGGPISFWYLAHRTGHDPCEPDHQGFCGPELGERALGPVLTLTGSW